MINYNFNKKTTKNFRKKLRKNQTRAEQILWFYIRKKRINGYKFRRQFGIGPYIIDFYCPKKKLAIEVDGGYHTDCYEYDEKRSDYLRKMNVKVVRFSNEDIKSNIIGIVAHIERILDT